MDSSSKELVRAVQAVSDVVEENIAATEEVATNTNEILRTWGNALLSSRGSNNFTVRM